MAVRISRWTIWVALSALFALLAAGCGGGDEGTREPTATPSQAASAAPATTPSSESVAPQQSGGGGEQTYVVESGDTLSAIARRFDTTVEAIVEANDITDPDDIDIGDEFVIPGGR
ncbi:hypothetical protein BH23ACT10_BH23ACT10_29420 [soil metagenome]